MRDPFLAKALGSTIGGDSEATVIREGVVAGVQGDNLVSVQIDGSTNSIVTLPSAVPCVAGDRVWVLNMDGLAFVAGVKTASTRLGTVGYAEITSNSAAITAVTDVGGLVVTWDAAPTRRYRTSINGVWQGTVANDLLLAYITDGSGNVKFQQHRNVTPGGYGQVGCSVVETGLSGSTQRKMQHWRFSGTGTSQILAGATYPAYILVEDIGT